MIIIQMSINKLQATKIKGYLEVISDASNNSYISCDGDITTKSNLKLNGSIYDSSSNELIVSKQTLNDLQDGSFASTTTLQNYVLTSTLSNYITSSSLSSTLSNYLTTALGATKHMQILVLVLFQYKYKIYQLHRHLIPFYTIILIHWNLAKALKYRIMDRLQLH